MELMEAIRKHVSVRNFLDTTISDDIITEILDAARLVPPPGKRTGEYHQCGQKPRT